MKKFLKYFLVIIVMIGLVSCKQAKERYRDTTFDAGFNTTFTLLLYADSEDDFRAKFEFMRDEARRLDQLYDIYNNYEGINNIKTINDMAGKEAVTVDQDIIDLLILAKEYNRRTNGLFDPTLGPVLKIWHKYREAGVELNEQGEYGPSPSQAELEEANQYVGIEYLEIDEVNKTVYLTNENCSLDVGAIAKGYAVELIARKFEEQGVENAVINAGGNIRTIGSIPDDKPWVIGIANPDHISDSSVVKVGYTENMSVVTSGDYQQYFIDDQGRRQHHLIDPRTLQPATYSRSVSVIIPNSGLADIISTAFAMTPLEDAQALVELLNMGEIGLIWVFDEKQEYTGFKYIEVEGKFVYYNDTAANAIQE